MLSGKLHLADGALERLPLLVHRLDVALEVVAPCEPLRTHLAREGLRGRLVVLVAGEDVRPEVVLLGKFLATLSAIERPDLLVNC